MNPALYIANFKDLVSPGLRNMSKSGQRSFSQIDRSQNRFFDNMRRNTQHLRTMQGGFLNLQNVATRAFAGVGLFEFGRAIVDNTAKFEVFDSVLTNTLGSKSEAQKSFKNILNFAKKSPFQVDELTGSFVKLVNRGIKPTQNEMRKLSDLSSSQGKGFDQLVEAALDAQTGEFERLKEFGIRAKKSGDQVQFTFKGVTKQVQFSSGAIFKYITSLGDATGVQGASISQMNTLSGKLSNLKDNFTQLTFELGTTFRPVITTVVDGFASLISKGRELTTWAQNNPSTLKAVGAGLAALAASLTIAKIATIKLNFAMLASPIFWIPAAIAGVAASFTYLYNRFEKFRGFIWGIWEAVKVTFSKIKETISNVFGGFGEMIEGFITLDLDKIKTGGKRLAKGILGANPIGFGIQYGKDIAKGYKKGFSAGSRDFLKANTPTNAFMTPMGSATNDTTTSGAGIVPTNSAVSRGIRNAGSSGAVKPKNINISVGKLVETMEVHMESVKDTSELKRMVERVMATIITDSSILADA